ncbi:hypothetical protein Fot_10915 [Forsythia ovata]|uniref:Uncharacterized protein n=1 Tax=Forsythia ovata TaxID=205694 RepID=A0ABD1WIU6_9LAMI
MAMMDLQRKTILQDDNAPRRRSWNLSQLRNDQSHRYSLYDPMYGTIGQFVDPHLRFFASSNRNNGNGTGSPNRPHYKKWTNYQNLYLNESINEIPYISKITRIKTHGCDRTRVGPVSISNPKLEDSARSTESKTCNPWSMAAQPSSVPPRPVDSIPAALCSAISFCGSTSRPQQIIERKTILQVDSAPRRRSWNLPQLRNDQGHRYSLLYKT